MRVMLATIALNEMEWLPKLVEQHKDWPGLVGWCIVEGCDPTYAKVNPDSVAPLGMSTDGTTEFLLKWSGGTNIYVPQGSSTGGDVYPSDQYKCVLRNAYLRIAHHIKPDIIVQLDADEFYTKADQEAIVEHCSRFAIRDFDAWMFRQRHIWRPPSVEVKYSVTSTVYNPIGMAVEQIASHSISRENPSLFSQEVVGGYWQVPHTRVWRYVPGMRHVRNHNWPEIDGAYMTNHMARPDLEPGTPECVHMGYASSLKNRSAKHQYYVARGEGQEGGKIGRKRSMYLDCREAWEKWRPWDDLPHGARVIGYKGPIPEALQ